MTLFALAACGGGASDYPNWPTKTVKYTSGQYGLQNWKPGIGPCAGQRDCISPDHDAYRGAAAWFYQSKSKDPVKAAKAAAKAQGLKSISVASKRRINRKTVGKIEPHNKGQIHMVALTGKLKGQKASAIMIVWYGRLGLKKGEAPKTGVQAFMAPTKQYEALGGYSIPAVLWLASTTTPTENMRDAGKLSAKASTKELAKHFTAWAENYHLNQMAALQTMAIQSQTLNQMMSYSNALAECGGGDCSYSLGADGTWSVD